MCHMSHKFDHEANGGPGIFLSRQYCNRELISRYAAIRTRNIEQA
jgi:hypothetical protein